MNKLKASYTLKVDRIFEKKGWEMEPEKELKLSLYNKYIDRLRRLPDDTKGLFLELTERFERIGISDITSLFFNAYNNIDSSILNEAGKIYLLPLVEPELRLNKKKGNWFFKNIWYYVISFFTNNTIIDRPKNKSGENLLAIIELSEYRGLSHSKKFIFPQSFSKFKYIFKKNNDLLILVDDFVGTGDTANDVLKYYFKLSKFNYKNTIILSLVSLNQGVKDVLTRSNVKVFQAKIKERAISDYYKTKEEIDINTLKVKSMEETLRCELDLSLGYKESQALISIMNKSPNNTLPVFWHETKSLPAPFPRRKIYNK
jgi:hypoxanthine phosphoribosyltransferase